MHGKNHVWRIGYAKGVLGDHDLDLRPLGNEPPQIMTDGWICYHPCMTYFRNGGDRECGNKHMIAGHVCFGYLNKSDLGGPVVDNEVRLAGVLVGADLGSQESHVGAYIPAELIIPFLSSVRKPKIHSEFRGQIHPVLRQIDRSEVTVFAA